MKIHAMFNDMTKLKRLFFKGCENLEDITMGLK